MKSLFVWVCIFFSVLSVAQKARIKGVVLDEFNQPLEGVTVLVDSLGTTTNKSGFYLLTIPANKKVTLVFSYIGFKKSSLSVQLASNEDYEFNPVLNTTSEQLGEVVVTANKQRETIGIVNLTPKILRLTPGANPGVENILKTLPGVYSNSDLSSQYAVRGGNYDENLVYVNEIEIYRPFLVRSGEQEGLSFTNTDLVQNIDFSAGGFQAKYGDKLSSVLDITYKIPKHFAASVDASALGVNGAIEQISKNQKWAAVTGVRYRDNSLLLNSQATNANYRPSFTDIQTYITYKKSLKWQWSFLGNISNNRYEFQPLSRTARFGTADDPKTLFINYQGQENAQFSTYFGALKSTYQVTENFQMRFIASAYHTKEIEAFDILANYRLEDDVNTIGNEDVGTVNFARGLASQLKHARNQLDALIVNVEVKGTHVLRKSTIEWGAKFTKEDIRDRVVEWEVIDSAGFVVNPAPKVPIQNNQPYEPYFGQFESIPLLSAINFVTINRFSGYLQWNKKWTANEHAFSFHSGVRSHVWQVNPTGVESGKLQAIVSPRFQFSVKPNWEKDIVIHVSTGLYAQPPFYRDLRDATGEIQANLKAQKSYHFVVGSDYSFKMWERPFKFVSEAYYKYMTDVNTYTIDNVRIRYRANNDAVAYAAGFDMRLNGEFVPGTESWFSLGVLKTQENQNNRGYIDRPTDQRVKVGILFQDYVPKFPNSKVYLNLVYSTGLPGGSPANADPYLYQGRLRPYRRADIGFAYVLIEGSSFKTQKGLKYQFRELSVGAELFNMFNIQNSNTNIWVRDATSKGQFAIPNFMTSRVLNFRITFKL